MSILKRQQKYLVAGAVCGIVALLLIFLGLYSIYLWMQSISFKHARLFLAASFVFCCVGTLYHCVFAMTAYIYQGMSVLHILEAKEFAEHFFNVFIGIAMPAAVSFAIAAVTLFLATIKNCTGKMRWMGTAKYCTIFNLYNLLLYNGTLIEHKMIRAM